MIFHNILKLLAVKASSSQSVNLVLVVLYVKRNVVTTVGENNLLIAVVLGIGVVSVFVLGLTTTLLILLFNVDFVQTVGVLLQALHAYGHVGVAVQFYLRTDVSSLDIAT